MRTPRRKTAPKVRDGRVQRKHRHAATAALSLVVRREPPGAGRRHVLTTRDVWQFLDLIPDWHELSRGMEQIVLARGGGSWDGVYERFPRERTAAIRLASWPTDLWLEKEPHWVREHAEVLAELCVAREVTSDSAVRCFFTPASARAYMLLHVFLHELGHHHDHLIGRGVDELPPERFAAEHARALWAPYMRAFGDPRRS